MVPAGGARGRALRSIGAAASLVASWALAGAGPARADSAAPAGVGAPAGVAAPVRIAIECEEPGRTKACPAFLLGFVEAHKVLLPAPRAAADVVLYATAAEVALVDRVHLRFVGALPGAPAVIELDVDLDSRAADDTQRAQLEPAFLRGVALYVAARHPKVVTVALTEPDGAAVAAPSTTPWGLSLSIGGFGNYTRQYQFANLYAELSGSRLERGRRLEASIGGSAGANLQPPLVLDDGREVSLDTTQWSIGGGVKGAWLHSRCWSYGGAVRGNRDDPKGQFRYAGSARAALEWDRYRADDPRGNRLALLYFAGYQIEGYTLRNLRGERAGHYPIHGVSASGSVRKDKISIGLSLAVNGMLLHPTRRHRISLSPFIEWKLGGHVDVNLSFSATKRELPAPDPAEIKEDDYEQLSRLSYADPFSLNGSLNLSIHWDRTNGARNDRLDDL